MNHIHVCAFGNTPALISNVKWKRRQRGHDSRFPDAGGVLRCQRDGLHGTELEDRAARRGVDPAYLRGLRRSGAPVGHRPGLVKVRSEAGSAKLAQIGGAAGLVAVDVCFLFRLVGVGVGVCPFVPRPKVETCIRQKRKNLNVFSRFHGRSRGLLPRIQTVLPRSSLTPDLA